MTGPQIIRPLVIRHVDSETPAGLVDGINTTYTTQYKFHGDTLAVYLNGLKLRKGATNDYIIIDNQTFIMNYAPTTGDVLLVDYVR